MIHTIDLHFVDTAEAIAAFVVPTDQGAVLVESGPHSTLPQLLAGLGSLGLSAGDVHSVLLTHIHFDHAGAAWWFAQQGAKVYVHPRGYKHLLDPDRLYNSARQIYGEAMDSLWGEMHPIAPDLLFEVADEEVLNLDGRSFRAIHSPGHATHHIAWRLDDCIFTGDVGGVKIGEGPVVPPCPPPDIHLADWQQSIAKLRAEQADRFYLTHYGLIDQTEKHLEELEQRLLAYVNWMKPYALSGQAVEEIVPLFTAFVEQELKEAGVGAAGIESYRKANPPYMSVAGLLRYWHKFGLARL